jgi:hypothetical protein
MGAASLMKRQGKIIQERDRQKLLDANHRLA